MGSTHLHCTRWKNLQSFIESGFDNILSTPNGRVQRLFTKLAFLNLGHPFQPFTMGQRVIAPNYAVKNNIKLSFYGENVGEYGNKIEDNFRPTMYSSWFTDFDIDNQEIMFGGVTIRELKEKYGLKRRDFIPYQSPSIDSVKKLSLEQHYMSYYIKWVPQENFYYAKNIQSLNLIQKEHQVHTADIVALMIRLIFYTIIACLLNLEW